MNNLPRKTFKKVTTSPELIEKIKYEKWNGELPTVQGSDSTIVDIGDVTSSSDNVG